MSSGIEFRIWQQALEPLDRYDKTQLMEPFRHSKVQELSTVPHGDFSTANHLLLPSFTAVGVANSLEENAEKSAIIERYLS